MTSHWNGVFEASLITVAGIPELAVLDLPTYEQTAIALATNRDQLPVLRNRLIQSRPSSPLYNADFFVSNLQEAFEVIWSKA